MTDSVKAALYRYVLQVGKWGMYVFDSVERKDIDMETVRNRLNTAAEEAERLREEIKHLDADLHDYRARIAALEKDRPEVTESELEKMVGSYKITGVPDGAWHMERHDLYRSVKFYADHKLNNIRIVQDKECVK